MQITQFTMKTQKNNNHTNMRKAKEFLKAWHSNTRVINRSKELDTFYNLAKYLIQVTHSKQMRLFKVVTTSFTATN